MLAAVTVFGIQTDITGPTGSGSFGSTVQPLPNGNFVVIDPGYDDGAITDVGAVYLYDGQSFALISTLKGSTTGDAIGTGGGFSYITVLSNGNFVVRSTSWDDGANANVGAVTWCSASTGCNGVVSSANSLIGGTGGDQVGYSITALTNGNYVVSSPFWDVSGGIQDAGAATWCSGTTGRTGLVSSSNSIIGGTAGNLIGIGGSRALTNGHYVVNSYYWDNPVGPATDAGAVTWGNGNTGTVLTVNSGNSLVGASTNDHFGTDGVFALTNGNYAAASKDWDNPTGSITDVGAAAWGNGSTGTSGTVNATNALIGGTSNDWIGANRGITPLTNGNYVVTSSYWREPVSSISNAGAVTWCNGNGGTVGLVSSSNSLVGGRPLDRIGIYGVIALKNGNYVVNSAGWDNPTGPVSNVGAATWGNGAGGTVGPVTSSNSLVGGRADDAVGYNSVALTNGNYVVLSQTWDNPTGPVNSVGAATWCSGTTGRTGLVTTANSLTGTKSSDSVGVSATALANGNYVVGSSAWQNASFVVVGAATWGNGSTGTTGAVATTNSLYGSSANDGISSHGILALANGNYVVNSPGFKNGAATAAGASTWGNGATGTIGAVSSSNSLVGGTAVDNVGSIVGLASSYVMPNGNYVMYAGTWDNPSGPITDAGVLTVGNGTVGSTGLVSSSNSLIGTSVNYFSSSNFILNDVRNYVLIGRPAVNTVTVYTTASSFGAALSGNFNAPATWGGSLPGGLDTATIPSGVTVSVPPSGGSNFAGLVTVNGTINGTGTLNGNLASGSTGNISPGTSPGTMTVNGNVTMASGSTFTAEINGTTVGTQYDQLKVNGGVTLLNATLAQSFGFTPTAGNAFKIIDNDGTDPVNGTFNNRPEGWRILVGTSLVAKLSYIGGDGNDVTFTIYTPSAANASVSGRVTRGDGIGIRNAEVVLTDAGGSIMTARTSSFGYYFFDGLEAGRTYVISVSSKQFSFAPITISVQDDVYEANFVAQ